MTQDAFIQQSRHELRSLPKQVVDEFVADYIRYHIRCTFVKRKRS